MAFQVKDVYAGSSVLLTGGTGFLGKVIVEKLLWTIDEIENIYLMIRTRKGKNPNERLAGLLHDPLFNRIRQIKPDAFNKLVAVGGDMMVENLGMDPEDMKLIRDNVNVVIHSAATVKFDEHLRAAVTMNVIGTKRIIDLCHQIKDLKVLVHVSTAYANCDRFETVERIYKSPIPPQKLVDAISWMDDETLTKITPKVLGLRPNTYTLTKALAESTIESEAKDIPVIIIRPSIVGAMWQGPLPGWTDNINGPTGIFTAVGRGVLTNMCGSSESKADIIPVDVVANMIIAAASHRVSINPTEIPVIHCSSGEINPLYWGYIVVFLEQFYKKYPMEQCFSVPSTYFHKSRTLFLLSYYIKHHIPAAISDISARFVGKRKNNVKLYGKVWKMIETLHFFTTRGWSFNANGMPALYERMTPEDQKEYNFDVRQVDWDSYLFDYVMGIKKYLLKENLENLERSRAHLCRLRLKRQIIAALVYAGAISTFGRKWKKATQYMTWIGAMLATYTYTEVSFRRRIPLKSLKDYAQTADYSRYLHRN
ncbi:hypothetical protein GCK72_023845 [Caenorhabditis remanei]|uniref:Fatty acyl-CoA reductase n=1 Tax=Caenorhabditis remanei TaxID=31234 RepID=E3M297_CAERE|nr:hypothetical protein GCK72_023845 [Caenorhabditis remanei]EFO89929.1 hypothetical protein CRE_07531 [Caenorhabditis remanei]KAF1747383.1 hypothetical protein GCK72_023845 [Caenorhabditis remanei]